MLAGPLILIAAMSGLTEDPGVAAGCADHWVVVLDQESFENNGAGKTFGEEELHAFWAQLAHSLRRTVNVSCDEGSLPRQSAEMVRDVLVHSASGATEPHIYSAGDRALHFEWIFAEENLAIPPDEEIVAAVACWIEPSDLSCPELGD